MEIIGRPYTGGVTVIKDAPQPVQNVASVGLCWAQLAHFLISVTLATGPAMALSSLFQQESKTTQRKSLTYFPNNRRFAASKSLSDI
jgi:hypothetical protein